MRSAGLATPAAGRSVYTESGSGFAMFVLTEYLDRAMAEAAYDKLHDGAYGGRIPSCP